MTAYLAMNGNDATAKLYPVPLTHKQLAAEVFPYQTFAAAEAALKEFYGKEPLGVIDLGYVKPKV